jgi:hypothetical protein
MTQYFLRKISFLVGKNNGTAIDLSQMHLEFHVRKGIVGIPPILEIRVWNLSRDTVRQLMSNNNGKAEFTQVSLQAGYQNGPFGTIFTGEVRYFRAGRASATDTYLDIYAAHHDQAWNYAIVNDAVPPGSSPAEVAGLLNDAFGQFGVQNNNAAPTSTVAYPRGKVCFGKASDVAKNLAYNADSQWSIQDSNQQYLQRVNANSGTVTKVNSATGMIGIPVQTIYGIEVKMLLNPNIKYGNILQINNADIQTASLDLGLQGYAQNSLNSLGAEFLDADGFYKVIAGEYEGNTRGESWYLTAVCVNMDSSTSVAAVQAQWLPGP